ncbi:unnamed protein product [Ranitomeya imitator]|uniref:UPAR/Ly6 domain-containing protein n=1 Tax=Ranitomeya imitator TaxID=111125 RepID=A0ABN9MNY8_9NEOB|nr:unnamed protein product [Ranitomeya imitator]
MQTPQLIYLTVLIACGTQTVTSLNCFQCSDPQCKNPTTTTCPARNHCFSLAFSQFNAEVAIKGCSPPELCNHRPPLVPPGVSYKSSCCDTNLCNSAITNKMSLVSAGVLVLVSLHVSRF